MHVSEDFGQYDLHIGADKTDLRYFFFYPPLNWKIRLYLLKVLKGYFFVFKVSENFTLFETTNHYLFS